MRRTAEKPTTYPKNPQTLGEHLLRERSIRQLHQKEAAKLLGVDEFTYLNWEKDRREPLIRNWPALIDFLGGDPNPTPTTLGERMKTKRRQMGWTARMAAGQAGVDEGTWRYAETSSTARTARVRSAIEACVGCTSRCCIATETT